MHLCSKIDQISCSVYSQFLTSDVVEIVILCIINLSVYIYRILDDRNGVFFTKLALHFRFLANKQKF